MTSLSSLNLAYQYCMWVYVWCVWVHTCHRYMWVWSWFSSLSSPTSSPCSSASGPLSHPPASSSNLSVLFGGDLVLCCCCWQLDLGPCFSLLLSTYSTTYPQTSTPKVPWLWWEVFIKRSCFQRIARKLPTIFHLLFMLFPGSFPIFSL